MIAYEVQLQYVIWDKIQFETKNSVRDKIQEKHFLLEKKIVQKKKKLPEKKMLSWISSAQSELSRTNRCLSSLSGIFIPQ